VISFPDAAAEPALLDPGDIADDLGPDGPIAQSMRQYEDRPAQRDMARAIATLYNDGGVGLIEAGTGVGKSLGYLLPALRWAALHGERTVVSTNTINLQEQLVRKDLPFLENALSSQQPVRFALLKGWRNYLCLLRLEQAKLMGPNLFSGQSNGLESIAEWAAATEDGSLSDLAYPPSAEVWDEVSAEPDLCTRAACPHFTKCFLFRARRKAAEAHVVVVNHHLLMSDIAVRRAAGNWEDAAVIPSWNRVVIDEGHHLEDAAAAHLGASGTRRGLQRLMSRLARTATTRRTGAGLLAALEESLRMRKSEMFSLASLDHLRERVLPAVETVRDKGALVFDLVESVLRESGQQTVRLTDDFATHPVWRSGLTAALDDFVRESALLTGKRDRAR
jgi:ATP-dependent DNA helicase DinG